jgi:hypothetical protein
MWILIWFSGYKTVHSDFGHRQIGIATESAALNTDIGSVGWLVTVFGHTGERRGQGTEPGRIGTWDNIRNAFWHCVLREFEPMSPNSAPFVVWLVSVCYIATCNPQHPVANVIVDGSSPFTRFLPTADSNCQPLFILRRGLELGRFWLRC